MRVQGPATWTREPGVNQGQPGLAERQPRSHHFPEARTTKEALTYIEVLYKSGRMEDLAALLRRSKVFREAWLMVQQSPPAGPEAGQEAQGSVVCRDSRGPANLPSLRPPAPGWALNPEPEPEKPKGAGKECSSPRSAPATNPADQSGLSPTGPPSQVLRAALRVYQDQERRYARERELTPQLSLRV